MLAIVKHLYKLPLQNLLVQEFAKISLVVSLIVSSTIVFLTSVSLTKVG